MGTVCPGAMAGMSKKISYICVVYIHLHQTIMRKSLLAIAFVFMLSGCSKKQDSLLLSDEIIEEVNLEDIATDVQVYRVKCSEPMKGIGMFQGIGDIIFGLSEDSHTIYWIKGDTVIAKLDKYGRGHGEYTWIEGFAYAQKDSILFIRTVDNRLMKYQGLECKYIGETPDFPSAPTMQAINSNTLLAHTYIDRGNNTGHHCLSLIDIETGNVIKEVCSMDNAQSLFFNRFLCQTGDSIIFIIPGPGKDDNQLYLYYNDKLTNILSFRYDDKWRIPESVLVRQLPEGWKTDIDLAMKVHEMSSYRISETYCNGGEDIIASNGRLMFSSFYNRGHVVTNIIRDSDVKRVILSIPGLKDCIFPHLTSGDYYITVFDDGLGTPNEDESNLNPLGKRIQQEVKKSDGDPVFLKYRIK